MKYQRSMTLGGKDIEITKLHWAAKKMGGAYIVRLKERGREEKRKGKRKKMK